MSEDGSHNSGAEPHTTNQRMELTAVLRVVEEVTGPLEIHSDSTYVVNCFNDRWYEGWRARGWKNAQKKPVANRDIWEPLIDRYLERSDELSFIWVKGHSGIELNELADQLAVAARDQLRSDLEPPPTEAVDHGAGTEPPWPADQAIVVTGVREPDGEQLDELEAAVKTLDDQNDVVVSGLRLGVELVGAEVALAAGVPVGIVLPYPDPVRVWSSADRTRFDAAVAASTWLITLDGDPAKPGPAIKQRNQWLWRSAVGAIVVGDAAIADEAEMAGLGVIAL